MSPQRPTVVGNDWSVLVPPPEATWVPQALVSICIPTRNPGPGLARTLRCIAEQTYPAHLFEVVIGDDGSDAAPPVLPDQLPYEASIVRQERTLDFGAGRARNLAARAASGDILFFLDADVIPERQVVESYARWFAQHDLAVPMGLCRFVDVEGLDDEQLADLVRMGAMADQFAAADVDDQGWRETHFVRTDDLRIEAIDAFRVTVGATLAVSTAGFTEVGGFPELGVRGVEDTAFGYRLHNDGGILILDRDAQHWHQGRRNLSDPARRQQSNEIRKPFVESMIPVKGFRRGEPPANPPCAVAPVARVRVHGDPDAAERTTQSITAHGSSNVAVTTDPLGSRSDPAFLQVDVPAGVTWGTATVSRLIDTMAQHQVGVVKAVVEGSDGDIVAVARTRCIRRAARIRPDADPMSFAGELFGTWWVDAASLALRSPHVEAEADIDEESVTLGARTFDALLELVRRAAK